MNKPQYVRFHGSTKLKLTLQYILPIVFEKFKQNRILNETDFKNLRHAVRYMSLVQCRQELWI